MNANESSNDEKRIALVIGNSNYKFASFLKNPINDADTFGSVLRKLKFDVILKKNLDLKDFKLSIQEFGFKIKDYQTVLFFFAGHGIQVNGTNYLVPIDANPASENQVDFETVNTNWILSLFENDLAPVNIVILDACRNDPFKRSWHRSPTRQGLSFVSAPRNTIISYSTSPDKTASDGNQNNSPFTAALAEEILNPYLNISQLFQIVRKRVIKTTNEEQIPWESTSLLNDFFFNTGQYLSIQTFSASLLYNNENDRVLNNLGLKVYDFERIKKLGLNISETDKQNGVSEVFVKRQAKIFVFESIEMKLYKDGMREYIFFANNFSNSKEVFELALSLYNKLGVGLYDDQRRRSFRDFEAINRIARKKTRSQRDECMTMWHFGRIIFFLEYLVEPSCQFIFRIKFTPDRRVIKGSVYGLLKLKISEAILNSIEIHKNIEDGKVHHVDYKAELDSKELKLFNILIIRIFGPEKRVDSNTSINIFLKTEFSNGNLNELSELVATLTSIYGQDSSSSGYMNGSEVEDIKNNRYWSGRWWNLNLQHQIWDDKSAGEWSLYSVNLSYDTDSKELELAVLGYDGMLEKLQTALKPDL